jgi:RES domain
MSLPIWTAAALSFERRSYQGPCWRLVEAQHQVSTLKLTDTLDEQAMLEDLLEETKPKLPAAARGLHYLMAAPFRYGAPYPTGSRFRRAGRSDGVFYGAERPQTAAAEMAFHRLLFYADSPATPWPADAAEFTAFNVPVQTERALDLTHPPFSAARPLWTDPVAYGPCQDFADRARQAEADLIRYESVRDPEHDANLAVLSPSAFATREPEQFETWRLRVGPFGAQVMREFPAERYQFDRDAFAADPRLVDMVWKRGQ